MYVYANEQLLVCENLLSYILLYIKKTKPKHLQKHLLCLKDIKSY